MGGRIAIPYITNTGIVQIRFRAVPFDGDPEQGFDGSKYMSVTNDPPTLFNVRDFMSQGLIAICEGEIDAMTAHICGIPAIGIPGANNWEKNAKIFSRCFRYRNVIILADNDDKGAGIKFAKDVQKSIRGSRIILMDEGYDVNSFFVKFGKEALLDKVGLSGT